MSFSAYPVYKESGVEWLGEVPEHWEVTKLSYVTSRIGSGKTPSGGAAAYASSGVPFIRSQNVHDQGLRLDDIVYIDEETDTEMAWSRVRPLDVLINITGASIGRSCQVPAKFGRANVNQHVCVIRLDKAAETSDWVAWFMKSPSSKEQVKVSQTGAAREGLNFEQLAGFYLCMPPLHERKLITAFLDHETARIDALIEEQQRLIELLKEKRQAVISHAVTKGLDPTVPMKDSGVEWLGEVPAHWEVGSLRRLIKSVGNGTTADQVDEAEDTVAVSRIETISAGLINFEKVGHVGPQDVAKRFLLNVGDILFSHINSLSMIGNVAIYSGGRPLLHGMNLLRIQPLPSISSEWLLYWLKSKNVRQEVESRAKPAINQASISTDSVRALPALIPPSFEQTQIARFLDYETARIDALIEEANSGVGLLQERRSALISAVVTGKIDVRGWQPPANIQAPESAVAEAV
ncbi:restriction endonuclease subunit S [Stutzerimonas frequens]|uniref:restriction endonuclease subunit S n=1 Tax=Stutzerimonas frequens TaxID=2968969 RepID=UPI00190A9B89|nr:restriction endonuclease subunit S [Stutzerimonas frequens]MBK3760369.1 restriction endonuclease subunit S [Stutzerimonas frequens]